MSIMSLETVELELIESGQLLSTSGHSADEPDKIQKLYMERIQGFSDAYQRSELKNDHTYLDKSVVPCSKNPKEISNKDASWCYQFSLLAQRNL